MGKEDIRTKYLLLCLASEEYGVRRDRFLDEFRKRASNLFGDKTRYVAEGRMAIFNDMVKDGYIKQTSKGIGRPAFKITAKGEGEKKRLWEEKIRPERNEANVRYSAPAP